MIIYKINGNILINAQVKTLHFTYRDSTRDDEYSVVLDINDEYTTILDHVTKDVADKLVNRIYSCIKGVIESPRVVIDIDYLLK